MGACFSASYRTSDSVSPTAKVVSLNGRLREYLLPIAVSQVLLSESASSSSSSSHDCFICDSDTLLYDDFIPALPSNDCLLADHIYFVLPSSKLQFRLSASDMAAMAVKASVALKHHAAANKRHRRKKARISPAVHLVMNQTAYEQGQGDEFNIKRKLNSQTPTPSPIGFGNVMSRSGSVRKLQRYTSRRAKLAVRSFRMRLSTIYEGIQL